MNDNKKLIKQNNSRKFRKFNENGQSWLSVVLLVTFVVIAGVMLVGGLTPGIQTVTNNTTNTPVAVYTGTSSSQNNLQLNNLKGASLTPSLTPTISISP